MQGNSPGLRVTFDKTPSIILLSAVIWHLSLLPEDISIQPIVEGKLLLQTQVFFLGRLFPTQTATVFTAPLAIMTVGTGMFFVWKIPFQY